MQLDGAAITHQQRIADLAHPRIERRLERDLGTDAGGIAEADGDFLATHLTSPSDTDRVGIEFAEEAVLRALDEALPLRQLDRAGAHALRRGSEARKRL